MIHQPQYVKVLIEKYLEGKASPIEIIRLRAAWKIYEDDELLQMIKEALLSRNYSGENLPLSDWNPSAEDIIHRAKKEAGKIWRLRLKNYLKIAGFYVLPALALIVFVVMLMTGSGKRQPSCDGLAPASEIPTAAYSCTVVLDGLQPVIIDSNFTGRTKRLGRMDLVQTIPGLVQLRSLLTSEDSSIFRLRGYRVSTAATQQYQVVLPDSTRIRLNALTTIRIPPDFSMGHRNIELDGEAYFEVAPGGMNPFIIKTKNGVLETHRATFNVNTAYFQTVAALVNGSLKVKMESDSKMMQYFGDVSVLGRRIKEGTLSKDSIAYFKHQDMVQLLTWKKVERNYKHITLRRFVIDVCRWYGLQFENLNCVPETIIKTKLCYKAPLMDAIAIFRDKGLKIRVTGDKISFCEPERNERRPGEGVTVFAFHSAMRSFRKE